MAIVFYQAPLSSASPVALAVGASARERMKRCGRCRHEYTLDGWGRLELVERIGADAIRGFVTSWPQEVAIEIRRCRACGAPIARKAAKNGP